MYSKLIGAPQRAVIKTSSLLLSHRRSRTQLEHAQHRAVARVAGGAHAARRRLGSGPKLGARATRRRPVNQSTRPNHLVRIALSCGVRSAKGFSASGMKAASSAVLLSFSSRT